MNRREFFLAVTATVMPESLAARRYRITMQKAREVAKLLGITTFRSNGPARQAESDDAPHHANATAGLSRSQAGLWPYGVKKVREGNIHIWPPALGVGTPHSRGSMASSKPTAYRHSSGYRAGRLDMSTAYVNRSL
jgi:hypothetical protein